jgi:hypothetical protein
LIGRTTNFGQVPLSRGGFCLVSSREADYLFFLLTCSILCPFSIDKSRSHVVSCKTTPTTTGKDQPPLRSAPSPPSFPSRPRSFAHDLFPRRDRPVRSGQGKGPRRILPRLDTCQQGQAGEVGVGVVGGCKGGCGEWVEEGVEEVVWVDGEGQGREG